jgi:hypothetical protein
MPHICALVTVKMNKPIDRNSHYISPGGFEVQLPKETCQFDFMDSMGYIDKDDPSIITFDLRHADYTAFPDMWNLAYKAVEITDINDCYVYIGENDDIEVEKLISFKLIISGDGERAMPVSNDNVKAWCMQYEKSYRIDYEFSDSIIQRYNEASKSSK